MFIYYCIYDLRVNSYLRDKKGYLLRFTTIADCIDYLTYVVNIQDDDTLEFYRFEPNVY